MLPALAVVDAPRFGYRGFMLDVARNFQPKALGAAHAGPAGALQAQRVPLPPDRGRGLAPRDAEPARAHLGRRAARAHARLEPRSCRRPGAPGPIVDRPWGSGFYTRADYVEILRYAAARHIEVIPELEMPGHARAAIKAMEARFRERTQAGDAEGARRYLLSDPEDRSEYTSAQLYHDNVMNPALESTYAFIERVVADLVAIAPRGGRAAAQPPHGRRRGAERRLAALAGGAGLHEAAGPRRAWTTCGSSSTAASSRS